MNEITEADLQWMEAQVGAERLPAAAKEIRRLQASYERALDLAQRSQDRADAAQARVEALEGALREIYDREDLVRVEMQRIAGNALAPPEAPVPPAQEMCDYCGERPVACRGMMEADAFEHGSACDECCTHDQTSGHCTPVGAPVPPAPETEWVEDDRPYPCGAFRSEDMTMVCALESDHDGDHQWVRDRHHRPEAQPEGPIGFAEIVRALGRTEGVMRIQMEQLRRIENLLTDQRNKPL
jgi:hypothetical protein